MAVLRPDRRRTARELDRGNLAQWDRPPVRHRDQDVPGDRLRVAAQVARIAQVDAVTLAAFHGSGDRLSAECGRDRVLHVADHQTVACERLAIRNHIEIVASDHAFRVGARRPGHGLHDGFDLPRQLFHFRQVFSQDLDADRGPDSGREHVGAGLDRHGPGVGNAGKLKSLVQFCDQPVDGQAGTPLSLGLEIDDRLEHLGRRGIGRGLGASRLAVDRFDLREGLDDLVLRLQDLRRLGDRQAR